MRRGLVYAFEIAVHPEDVSKLGLAFESVAQTRYCPIQSVNIADGRKRLVFGTVVDEVLETITLDVIFKNQTALACTSPESLINRRERSYGFWRPQLQDAFAVLLAEAFPATTRTSGSWPALRLLPEPWESKPPEAALREIFGSQWGTSSYRLSQLAFA